jgi:NAD(P)-dependent dehydrogenase (short-subunit alcohol dehydrogenase family)
VDLRGSIAVVTGAAAGTGRVIAQHLAAAGAEVIVADLDEAAGAATAVEIGARFLAVDMRDPHSIERLIRASGPLRVLVNNAGGFADPGAPHFPEGDAAGWAATLDLNLRGPMLATQLALAPMRAAGGGAVVNIASSAGLGFGAYGAPEYGAAKAGLIRVTTSLADLDGVRVNCIVPDWILTERARGELEAMTEAERAAAPEPRPPEEIARAVVDLAADETLRGRVLVMWPGEPPRLLAPDLRL